MPVPAPVATTSSELEALDELACEEEALEEEGALLCGAWEDGREEDSKSEEGLDDTGRVLDVPEEAAPSPPQAVKAPPMAPTINRATVRFKRLFLKKDELAWFT